MQGPHDSAHVCLWHVILPSVFEVCRNQRGGYQSAHRSCDAQGQNATHIVDKMLRNAYNLAYIQMALPGACLIHAVRHPLDVALSCFAQPFEGRGLPWASQLDGTL